MKPATQIKTAPRELGLGEFFSASEARVDRWRSLHRLAKGLAGSQGSQTDSLRAEAADLLAAMEPIEDLCGFPGHRLMAQAQDRRLDRFCAPGAADQFRAAVEQLPG